LTIARDAPTSALNKLDLPTLGAPTIATCGPSRIKRPRRALASKEVVRAINSSMARTTRRIDKMITLVRKIDRSLEPGDEVEYRRIDLGDGSRQRAVELIERRAPAAASPRR
jgi:hypothetical protein